MPRGGKRFGAGRKRKPAVVIHHPSSALPSRSVISPPTTNAPSLVEEFDAPDSLSQEERQVWLQQAPHAFLSRTLTRASALSFERYCRVVVLEKHEAQSSGVGGPNHRGLLREIRSYETQFMLIPVGRPMAEPAKPGAGGSVDEHDSFFESRG
jgi:hypothetical protein